ncbi:MAG TPA: HAD family phosphatase [Blastocatellia bacterium]|nr:HAD family phosphatase [Blastocatellia bacterium]
MLKAIIFDCDGVIANTEPLHMAAFQRVLRERGIDLSADEYYRDYLAHDDRGCFEKALSRGAFDATPDLISGMIALKASYLLPVMQEQLEVFAGVREFVADVSSRLPIAIASGALRHEVKLILECAGIAERFIAVVAAEDVKRGKPDPEAFLEALGRINAAVSGEIKAKEALVIEDSIPGVKAAKAAGMRCLAVTNTYPGDRLTQADIVVNTLEGLNVTRIEGMLGCAEC